MQFRKSGLFREIDLASGPDLFRPGSLSCRGPGIVPLFTFVYTVFGLPSGERLILRTASVGHELILPEPATMGAMFGPDFESVTASARYTKTIYGDRDPTTGAFAEIGEVEDYDNFALRRLSIAENLLGRYGHFRSVPVVMLWNQPPAWEVMLPAVIDALVIPPDGVITVGTSELGSVREFLAHQAAGRGRLS